MTDGAGPSDVDPTDEQGRRFLDHTAVLAEGEVEGIPWVLRAGGDDRGYMYAFNPYGSSGVPIRLPHSGTSDIRLGCFGTHDRGTWGGRTPDGRDLVLGYTAGAVDPAVASVRVLGEDGTSTAEAQVVPFDERVGFFVAVYGQSLTPAWVVAYDEAGNELDRHTLRRLLT